MKPSQNKDFGSRSPAKTQRDKKAGPSFNPEDLKRGSNAEVGLKDYFEIASSR
ncbi:MAG: hypothetical protein OER74_18410 [Desulfobacteraceae bacterium]|nr:hypothetical protein [Desulfobacteraceae bacterium]